jgi:predicted transcriptional regulator of viral defense system
MTQTKGDKLLALVRRQGVVRARDLAARGIPRIYLARLQRAGLLDRPSRGMYILTGTEPTEHHSLVTACKRVPHGVVCLLSALRFHGLTTQAPFEVWLAIDRKGRLPRVDYPPLRIVRFSGTTLADGVKKHTLEGVTIRVTDQAHTVADCFKYRNKIGLDVALEALRDCWREKRATMDQLQHAAQARRMTKVMRPYLDSLT